jgi:hypothetical protein
MKVSIRFFASMALSAGVAAACSSGGPGASDGGGAVSASCVASAGGSTPTAGCTSCLEASCAQELSDVQAGCADYLACICPGGTYRQSLVSGCATEGEEQTCVSPSQSLNSCQSTGCAQPCSNGPADGGLGG